MRAKDVTKPQGEFPKDLISKSGRMRKIKEVSRSCLVGRDKEDKLSASIPKSDKVTTAKATTTTKLENSEKVETKSVRMEEKVAPIETVEGNPKPETVKDKSRVNVDLLQKVLTESVEEWFNLTEVVKSNKGKPYKKRRIVLPPIDESDFCFELTETKDTVKSQEDGNKKIDSTLEKPPETPHTEEREKEDVALKTNKNGKLRKAVIKKECKTTVQSDKSEGAVNEVVKKKQDERVEKEDTEESRESLKANERSENEEEKATENGKNERFRHFFALILYGDQADEVIEPQMGTSDSKQAISSQQTKTVIKTLDLETADLKEIELALDDLYKLPKDSPIFECVNGIEKLLETKTTGSTLRRSLSAESLNVVPKSGNERPKRSAEMPTMLPSRQRKMNLKAQECFFLLRKDIIEEYKSKAEHRMKEEAQKLTDERNNDVKAKEMIVEKVKHKEKPKTNESNHEKTEKVKINGAKKEKVVASPGKPEIKVVTNVTVTKTRKGMRKKQMDTEENSKMSELRFKKRKRFSPRSKDKFFSYVNKIKRKSGYKSSTESSESQNLSNDDLTPKPTESTQETRVDNEKKTEPKQEAEVGETKERRKSHREIKLTPKLVHMIATSHRRTRRSPTIRENSVEDIDYEYPNLIKKVVSGTGTLEVVASPSTATAIENNFQSKMEANVSDSECSWEPGVLVWARFAGSPFWPSLILSDPFSNDEYSKVKHWGRVLKTFVHLQFLSDSGKRAWVPELYCMNFNGLDEFEKMKSNLPTIDSFTKRNDILYQKAFFPSKKMEKAWLDAVKEGENLLAKSKEERITYMKIKYPLVKYSESFANGQIVTNGKISEESENLQLGTRKRRTRSSFWMESSDRSNSEEVTTADEASIKTDETFECVRPTSLEDNKKGDEKEAPKITLKLVRSPKKEEKRKWSKSLEGTEGELTKRPKKNLRMSNSEGSSGSHKKIESSKGGRMKQVCQVCLEMVENENDIKYKGVCPGLFPKGADVPSLEEGTASALKKRKRRRKFSSPHVNRWKQKLWTIFDFYNEFGGCKRGEMDVQGLLALYRSLCKNKTGNRRRSSKLH